MGQSPITYIRQVVAGGTFNELLDTALPKDASDQARKILSGCGGQSLGAYSDSAGVRIIREDIAR